MFLPPHEDAVCYYLGPAFFVIRPELKDLYRFGVFESL